MNRAARQAALRQTLERRGIGNPRVLDAIAAVPRDRFVPEAEVTAAYADIPLAIGWGQTISQPYIVALMTEALELTGDERILEIGTGSGYQSAVLSRLCREIVTIERLEPLAVSARAVHRDLGIENVIYRIGDGTLGCPEFAPYDGILVTAAAPEIPEPLFDQLGLGGRMIVPVGGTVEQDLLRVTKTADGRRVESLCECRFVKLIGAAGWPPEEESDSSWEPNDDGEAHPPFSADRE